MLKKHKACVHAEEMSFGGSVDAESTAIGSGRLCLNKRSYNVTGTSSAQHALQVANRCKPLGDYENICELQLPKGIDLGSNYYSQFHELQYIADEIRFLTADHDALKPCHYVPVIYDESTEISFTARSCHSVLGRSH